MKRIAKGLSLLVTLLGTTLALAGTVKEYSADMVDVKTGKLQSKVYVTPTKMRTEDYDDDGKLRTISIVRMDHQKTYLFFVNEKAYTEFPLKGKTIPERNSPEAKEFEKWIMGEFASERKEEKVGTETVNGYKTEKFRVTTRIEKLSDESVSYEWYAKEFIVPVRAQHGDDNEDGDIEELRNIKIGAPASSLFELPSGYKLHDTTKGKPGQKGN
jgi:hypothetical protein